MVTQVFSLDLFPGKRPPVVRVSQYDRGTDRVLRAYIYKDGEPFALSSGTTATVEGTNREGSVFREACTVSASTELPGYVEFALTDEMTSINGDTRAKVTIKQSGTSIGTTPFHLWVDPAGADPAGIPSSGGWMDAIIEAVETVLADGDIVGDAVVDWLNDHPEATTVGDAVQEWLDDHPEATTTVEDGSITYDKLAMGDDLQSSMAEVNALQRKALALSFAARRSYVTSTNTKNGMYTSPYIGSSAVSAEENDLNCLADKKYWRRLVIMRYYAGNDTEPDPDGTGEDADPTSGGDVTSGGENPSTIPTKAVNTKNTPWNAVLPNGQLVTDWVRGVVFSYVVGGTGVQFAIPAGHAVICMRAYKNYKWEAWTRTPTYNEFMRKAWSPVRITSQPENVTAAVNTYISFSVTAAGSNLSYQWQYLDNFSGDPVAWKNSEYSSATTSTLSGIKATTARDGMQWRCLVYDNSTPQNRVVSNAARLTVTE